MKVLNLRCAGGHIFEGWFGSEEDYQSQKMSGLLVCPVCGHAEIEKGLNAPRLKAKSNSKPAASVQQPLPKHQQAVAANPSSKAQAQALANIPAEVQTRLQAEWMQMARQLVAKAEDVGDDFANEARRIHTGDAPERAILGQATPEQAHELLEEGIAVLPLPEGIKNSLQ